MLRMLPIITVVFFITVFSYDVVINAINLNNKGGLIVDPGDNGNSIQRNPDLLDGVVSFYKKPGNEKISFEDKKLFWKFVIAAVFSLFILVAALYVILSRKFAEADSKWAYGSVGAILGYWLG